MRQKKSKFTIEFGFGAGKPLGSWRDIPAPVVINDGAVKTLRPDQKLACKMLRGALRWVLNQPTASWWATSSCGPGISVLPVWMLLTCSSKNPYLGRRG